MDKNLSGLTCMGVVICAIAFVMFIIKFNEHYPNVVSTIGSIILLACIIRLIWSKPNGRRHR